MKARQRAQINRRFLLLTTGYEAAVLVGLLILHRVTDVQINGQGAVSIALAAVFTLIVVYAWLLAISAAASVRSRRRRGLMRWSAWPPEWDGTVAAWAVAKALFFSTLWFLAAGWAPPLWVFLVVTVAYERAHALFTAQWLGMAPRLGMAPMPVDGLANGLGRGDGRHD